MLVIVGILTSMSRINFMLSLMEHEKNLIISGQVDQETGLCLKLLVVYKLLKFLMLI